MKLDLLTNASGVDDDAIRFVSGMSKEKMKSASDKGNKEESIEVDCDENKDQLEKE